MFYLDPFAVSQKYRYRYAQRAIDLEYHLMSHATLADQKARLGPFIFLPRPPSTMGLLRHLRSLLLLVTVAESRWNNKQRRIQQQHCLWGYRGGADPYQSPPPHDHQYQQQQPPPIPPQPYNGAPPDLPPPSLPGYDEDNDEDDLEGSSSLPPPPPVFPFDLTLVFVPLAPGDALAEPLSFALLLDDPEDPFLNNLIIFLPVF